MKKKKQTPKRTPNSATRDIHALQEANARIARICPRTGAHAATTNQLPHYLIDSVEMDLRMESPTGKSPVQRARVTYLTDRLTNNVMAMTVHFEPDYDLEGAGGARCYDPRKHAAAEIEHFRRLFPNRTN